MRTAHRTSSNLSPGERDGLLADALAFLAQGLSVIPIRLGTKKAACRWEKFTETPAEPELAKHWFAGKQRAIAVVLGAVSGGLICRDFDTMPAFERWAAEHADLADRLPIVATSRGRHVYARATPDTIAAIGKCFLKFDDGELRLSKCYCLLPPSRHPDGTRYEFVRSFDSLEFVDLQAAGFLSATERTESAERAERPERTEKPERSERTETHRRIPEKTEAMGGGFDDEEIAHVERAIAETLPSEPGQRHRLVFEFARALKGIPSFSDAAAQDLKAIVRRWHESAKPFMVTKAFEETWLDFLSAWPRVKFPRGAEPVAAALARARASDPPAAAREYEQAELRLLVALCRELQFTAGDGAFYLSVRTAGRLLNVDHTTASRWLKLLRLDGIIAEIDKGSASTRKASRFRYVAT